MCAAHTSMLSLVVLEHEEEVLDVMAKYDYGGGRAEWHSARLYAAVNKVEWLHVNATFRMVSSVSGQNAVFVTTALCPG